MGLATVSVCRAAATNSSVAVWSSQPASQSANNHFHKLFFFLKVHSAQMMVEVVVGELAAVRVPYVRTLPSYS